MKYRTTDDSRPEQARTPASRLRRGRVFLIENCPIVGRAAATLINRETDLELCGMADGCPSALEKLGTLQPDLVILGTALQGREGLDLLREIKSSYPRQSVLLFSIDDEALFAARALREGAAGYVMKDEPTETFLTAIRKVLSGKTYVSERLQRHARERGKGHQPAAALDPLKTLTERELEVFRLIGQGYARRRIAQTLGTSAKAVDYHRAQIKQKLGLKTANEVVRHAIEMQHEALPEEAVQPHEGT